MKKRKIIGIILITLAMIISLVNILDVKISGAVVGIPVESSLITIITIVFFVMGLLFLSKLERGLITGAIVVGGLGAANYKIQSDRDKQYLQDTKTTAKYWSDQGAFQRTYRWDETFDKAEKKYHIPKGLLKGLVMRESYGDPLKLNSGKDGGGGLFMFQPRTARAFGLKVAGKSNKSSADTTHGKELKLLVSKKKYDYMKLKKVDERFDIQKATDAAARYLKGEHDKYHSWNKALSAYNQGKPAPHPGYTEHVMKVREFQKYYNKRDKINHNSIFRKLAFKDRHKSAGKHR
jgi:hypothetical protein